MLRDIIVGILGTVVFVLGVETLARAVKTLEADRQQPRPLPESEVWSVPSSTVGWTRKPAFVGHIADTGRHPRAFDAHGYLTVDSSQVQDATPGRKVIAIGDSNTFGWGNPTDASFVEVIDRLLDVDAINLAVPGHSSYQGRFVLEEYLVDHNADLVIASFNFNDRRYVLPMDLADGADKFEPLGTRASRASPAVLEWSYAFRAFRRLARLAGFIPTPPPDVTEVRVDLLRPRVSEEAYARNLATIAELTRRHAIPLVFLLLHDSPIHAHHLREGLAHLMSAPRTAVAHLTLLAEAPGPYSKLARLTLVEAYRALGDEAGAERVRIAHRLKRSLAGGEVIRLDSTYNDIMRQVGLDHGVAVVDGGALVDAADYIDAVHFNAEGHWRIGELLSRHIVTLMDRGHACHSSKAC